MAKHLNFKQKLYYNPDEIREHFFEKNYYPENYIGPGTSRPIGISESEYNYIYWNVKSFKFNIFLTAPFLDSQFANYIVLAGPSLITSTAALSIAADSYTRDTFSVSGKTKANTFYRRKKRNLDESLIIEDNKNPSFKSQFLDKDSYEKARQNNEPDPEITEAHLAGGNIIHSFGSQEFDFQNGLGAKVLIDLYNPIFYKSSKTNYLVYPRIIIFTPFACSISSVGLLETNVGVSFRGSLIKMYSIGSKNLNLPFDCIGQINDFEKWDYINY